MVWVVSWGCELGLWVGGLEVLPAPTNTRSLAGLISPLDGTTTKLDPLNWVVRHKP